MSDALLDHATQTMNVGSKSFATASRLFDADTRRSALMLYAWCRHCDDVVDGQELGFALRPPHAQALEDPKVRLAALFEETRRAYAGQPMDDPAFAAFQEVAQRHGIPERHAFEHLDGFAMDVHQRQYQTLDDTLDYCYHVAGVVGLMMARVMGVEDEPTLDRACDLGLAFQLTNIARDIVDDAEVGRCYLPLAWLDEAAIDPGALTAPEHREKLAVLATRLVEHAEPYYHSAVAGIGALPLRSAWAIATARGVYREIGLKVRAEGAHAWDRRLSTNRWEKVRLLMGGAGVALTVRSRPAEPRPAALWQRPLG